MEMQLYQPMEPILSTWFLGLIYSIAMRIPKRSLMTMNVRVDWMQPVQPKPLSWKSNSSKPVLIKGLKIGCTPSESFLASTLECFYDSSCIDLIQEQTNYNNRTNATKAPIPLFPTESRFSVNATVRDLANALFIEDWSATINYSSYFKQCSPSLCSYTYVQQLDSVYTVTFLVGIYGGLTIILKLICSWAVLFVAKMNAHRKKKTMVQPVCPVVTPTAVMANTISNSTNGQNATANIELPTAPATAYASFRLILIKIYRNHS